MIILISVCSIAVFCLIIVGFRVSRKAIAIEEFKALDKGMNIYKPNVVHYTEADEFRTYPNVYHPIEQEWKPTNPPGDE